jgi:hypothetical protein
VQERGSIGETGRYKGQPVPMASATIEDVDLDNILANLLAYYSSIKEAGVEDIWLTVTLFYTDQCNWEFTREQMKLMVEMNISLSISCQVVE